MNAAIVIIAIAASGVLMMRFRKRWLAKINIAFTNRIAGCSQAGFLASRLRHPHACGKKVRQGLPYTHKRLSSVERLHHRAHVKQSFQQPCGRSDADLFWNFLPASSPFRSADQSPIESESRAMPAYHRIRRDQEERVLPVGPESSGNDPEQSIG